MPLTLPSALRTLCHPVPGSVKTLHLFEARYISLLDEVLGQPGSNKLFAHVVVEQQGDTFGETAAAFPGAYQGDGYVFVMATLVRVRPSALSWRYLKQKPQCSSTANADT